MVVGDIKSSSLGHRPKVVVTQQILVFDVDFLGVNRRLITLH